MITLIQQLFFQEVNSISMQMFDQAATRDDNSISEEKPAESIGHKVDAKSIDSVLINLEMNLNSSK
jgi:hypothetical protein